MRVATDRVDWEVELVAVIGRRAHHVDADSAWDHVAGLMVGQDLSARDVQMSGSPPQFSLGKSFPGFGPTGPWLVTADELPDRDDLAIGVLAQRRAGAVRSHLVDAVLGARNRRAAFGDLSAAPGRPDLHRARPRASATAWTRRATCVPGDELVSTIEGIGSITTRFR